MEQKHIPKFSPRLVRFTIQSQISESRKYNFIADAYEEFKQNIQVFQHKSERIERDIIDNNSETLEVCKV